MKNLFIALLIICVSGLVQAQTVVVNSPSETVVNGFSAGAPADVIANSPHLAVPVQLALVAYFEKQRLAADSTAKTTADAHTAVLVKKDADHAKAMSDAQATAATALKAAQDKAAADIAALRILFTNAGLEPDFFLNGGPNSLRDYLAPKPDPKPAQEQEPAAPTP